jgi:hypothetical protein
MERHVATLLIIENYATEFQLCPSPERTQERGNQFPRSCGTFVGPLLAVEESVVATGAAVVDSTGPGSMVAVGDIEGLTGWITSVA